MPVSTTSTARPFHTFTSGVGIFLRRYGVELVLIGLLGYLLVQRGLAVQVDLRDPARSVSPALPSEAKLSASDIDLSALFANLSAAVSSRLFGLNTTDVIVDLPGEEITEVDPAPHISNLTLILSPDYAERKGLDPVIVQAKRRRVNRYLDRYAPAARRDMRDHGIPASITLAQALLESNAGDSRLATESNNHFGIKCRTKCLGCTCRNYGDDTRYDMFRVFEDAEGSFQEHSRLLNTPRYARLHQYGTDYRKWAHGLKACGYATDKHYADKLIQIIEHLDLHRYDHPQS
jgi:hypothetical protein